MQETGAVQVVERAQAIRDGRRPLRPPPAWAEARRLLAQGQHDRFLAAAPRLQSELAGQPHGDGYQPALVLAVGAELAARDRIADAIATLHHGLRLLPGTPSVDEVGGGAWHALALTELLLVVGDLNAADAWTHELTRPHRPLEIRLGATRAAAHLRATRGEHDRAHQLLNTATGMAARARSRLQAALVEADRAVVLAGQGRTPEAVRTLGPPLDDLARPVAGPHGRLAAAQAVAAAGAVALAAADLGDELSARQLADVAARVATAEDRPALHPAALLAEAAARVVAGDPWGAEAPAFDAARRATALGAAPLAARAVRLQGDLAAATGRLASARPLHRRALDEQRRLGLWSDAATTERAMARADAHR